MTPPSVLRLLKQGLQVLVTILTPPEKGERVIYGEGVGIKKFAILTHKPYFNIIQKNTLFFSLSISDNCYKIQTKEKFLWQNF